MEFDVLTDVELFGLLNDDTTARDPTSSTSLRKLHVRLHTPYIWDSLTIPSLHNLTVDNVKHRAYNEVPWTRNHSFLRRSLSSLTNLQITAKDVDYPEIFDTFRDLNTLESLIVLQLTLQESFFLLMHGTLTGDNDLNLKDTELFLPRLRYFEYRAIRKFKWHWVSLLLPPTSSLRRDIWILNDIRLSFARYDSDVPRYIDQETLSCISNAKEAGVGIDISEALGITGSNLQSLLRHRDFLISVSSAARENMSNFTPSC
ncbi:hypothetical protein CPB83DRAFT_897997 [Crepidotus variabilis]|uniref:Uncharacterized protein n=1 Tax=Crepidotus variabilis TaxID=179855 RepID=A0A9P6JKL4_9AGAR|nr:hypothetical protein CPB83DRAFT_897997 [Crepidotus variabilis]